MRVYRTELRKTGVHKTRMVFRTFLRTTNNEDARDAVDKGRQLGFSDYLKRLHRSRYVVAPNGDRPECYRHWEAIGLGTIPLTQLDEPSYPHFRGSGLVFNYSNVNESVETLARSLAVQNSTKRRMVLEEYWMEYVDRIVGRSLQWWDRTEDRPATTLELAERWKRRLATKNEQPRPVADGNQSTTR